MPPELQLPSQQNEHASPDQTAAAPGLQAEGQRRVFLIWAIILTALWVFANWPRAWLGSLKSFLVWAGMPCPFAHWDAGRLEWFKPVALVADLGVWVGLMLVAWLCAWSRRPNHHSQLKHTKTTLHDDS